MRYFGTKKAFHMLILLLWMQTILLNYIRAMLERVPFIGSFVGILIVLVYVVLIVLSIPEIRVNAKDIVFYFVAVIVFLLQWLIYKESSIYIEEYFIDFLLKALPLYFVGLNLGRLEEKDEIIHHMYVISIITILASIIIRNIYAAPMDEITSLYVGDMDHAYKLLPHCCLIVYFTVKKINWVNIAMTIISLIYILLLGTRGAALNLLLCIALCIITSGSSRKIITRVIAIAGSVFVFVASPLYMMAINALQQLAVKVGLSIRIFDKLLTGSFAQFDGRNTIRERLLEKIIDGPLFGNGICSDRVVVGTYAHNIIIELWMGFGIIIGSIFLILLVTILIRGFMKCGSSSMKGLILSLICACFFKLFLSGSYLDEQLLFLLIGLCVYNIRRYRSIERSRDETNSIAEPEYILGSVPFK